MLSLLVFGLWIFFFDTNDLITQYDRQQRLEKLKKEKSYYLREIKKIERTQAALTNDSAAIERFAREKYFLKKPKEEVFVIEEVDNTATEAP
ncbi:MAG: septum formation initiator family protein [Microscillaceae bacterium]|nr:septum formation initiator family protein [Microscillaceae bacterium]